MRAIEREIDPLVTPRTLLVCVSCRLDYVRRPLDQHDERPSNGAGPESGGGGASDEKSLRGDEGRWRVAGAMRTAAWWRSGCGARRGGEGTALEVEVMILRGCGHPGRASAARGRGADPPLSYSVMPSNKTFRTKVILSKAAKQNR